MKQGGQETEKDFWLGAHSRARHRNAPEQAYRGLPALPPRVINFLSAVLSADKMSAGLTTKMAVLLADALRHDFLQVFHIFGRSIMMLHFGAVTRNVPSKEGFALE